MNYDFKHSDNIFRVFNEAHESQFNICYDHHEHRTELVLVEACCQSGLPGFEGAWLGMQKCCVPHLASSR